MQKILFVTETPKFTATNAVITSLIAKYFIIEYHSKNIGVIGAFIKKKKQVK